MLAGTTPRAPPQTSLPQVDSTRSLPKRPSTSRAAGLGLFSISVVATQRHVRQIAGALVTSFVSMPVHFELPQVESALTPRPPLFSDPINTTNAADHYHERMTCLWNNSNITGHSTKAGDMLDLHGLYGYWES
jgi:hypothetical protein